MVNIKASLCNDIANRYSDDSRVPAAGREEVKKTGPYTHVPLLELVDRLMFPMQRPRILVA